MANRPSLIHGVLGLALLLALAPVAGAQSEESAGADREWRFIEKLRQDGMVDVAAGQLEEFARNFGQDARAPRALLEAGRLYEEMGQQVAARRAYESVLESHPSSDEAPAAAFARAELLGEAGQWSAAAEAYRSLLGSYPAAPQVGAARLGLSEALMALERDEEARSLLHRLIGGREDAEVSARARFNLGVLAQRAGADSLAIENFDSIHRLHPEQPIAGFGLLRAAELLRKNEATASARERYETLLDLDTAPLLRARARFGLAELLREEEPREAMEQLREITEEGATEEQLTRALLELAEIAVEVGDPDQARRATAVVLERFDEGEEAQRARLLAALADLGEREDAPERLSRLGAEAAPALASRALRRLGDWQEEQGRLEMALGTFQRLEAASPESAGRAEAARRQAELALRLGRPALAADLAQRAHDLAPETATKADALLLAVRASEEAGHRATAISRAEELVHEYPLTSSATRGRDLLRTLRRRAAYDPVAAARELAGLAVRQIDDPAVRGMEVGRILRDRLGDAPAAIDRFQLALEQAPTPALRSQADLELAETHRQQALEKGIAGEEEAASRHLDRARAHLTDAAARAGGEREAQRARLQLVGLDLAAAAQPREPWLFDAATMPLLGGVGRTENLDLRDAGLDPTRDRLARALEQVDDADERAWLTWRSVELSAAPVAERLERLEGALAADPSEEMRLALRFTRGQLHLMADEPSAAARELGRVLERAPTSELALAARYGLAEAHRAERRYAQAYDLYVEFATAYPQSRRGQRALLLAGDCAFFGGDPDRAVARYRELLERYPDTVYVDDALYRLGTALQRAGRLQAARDPMLRLTRFEGGSDYRGRALVRLAEIDASAGRDSLAAESWEELLEVDPERAREAGALGRLAEIELERGRAEAAIGWTDRVPAEERSAELRALRVRALATAGRTGPAAAELEDLSRSYADQAALVAEARCVLGEALAEAGRIEEAQAAFAAVVEESPSAALRARAHYRSGVLAARNGDLATAREQLEAARRSEEPSTWVAEALYQLGSLASREGDHERARDLFARLHREFPRHEKAPDALSAEALSWRRLSRYDEALERYHELLERYPDRPGSEKVLSNIAYCHHELGQYEVSLQAYRRVMPYLDQEGQAYAQFWIADSLAGLERYEEAAAAFLRIPYLYPDEGQLPVTAQLKAAEVYERMGNVESAVRLYQKVLANHGAGSQWGAEAQRRLDRLASDGVEQG